NRDDCWHTRLPDDTTHYPAPADAFPKAPPASPTTRFGAHASNRDFLAAEPKLDPQLANVVHHLDPGLAEHLVGARERGRPIRPLVVLGDAVPDHPGDAGIHDGPATVGTGQPGTEHPEAERPNPVFGGV